MTTHDFTLILLMVSTLSLILTVGFIFLIGVVVMRLLKLFMRVNESTQALRADVRSLMDRGQSLTFEERKAFMQVYHDS